MREKQQGIKRDLLNEIFDQLTVIADAGFDSAAGSNRWLVQCACGNKKVVLAKALLKKQTKTCGTCQPYSRPGPTHGLSRNRFYTLWRTIIARCENQKSSGYSRYGAKGVTVCQEWHDMEVFIAWCEQQYWLPKFQLLRLDKNGPYSPANCYVGKP